MKKIILLATCLMSLTALAQNEMTVNFGLNQSALNAGGTFVQMRGSSGMGGYFQFQGEKNSIQKLITLGGLYKINVVENSSSAFYAAPGFGLSMVQVNEVNAVTGLSSKTDKTVFGPSMKLGAQMKLSNGMALGVERMVATNWFEETASGSYELTTAALTFVF